MLLDYKSDIDWPRAFSIFHDADAGIVILHRQGTVMLRHHLPGPLPQAWDLARLTYEWNGPARTWSLTLQDAGSGWAFVANGINPLPMAGGDVLALCAAEAGVRRDASVQWFGVSLQTPRTPPAMWVGHRTPIETLRGRIAAVDLRLGDQVATLDGGHLPLQALHRMTLPNRGRLAPVLLRAPYFGRQTDLLVAPEQLTLLSGASVEYLFGEDAVLAPAAALRDGNTALSETRRTLTTCISLDLGAPALILADGCPLLCGAQMPLPYRLLRNYEVLPLQSLLHPGGQRSAA